MKPNKLTPGSNLMWESSRMFLPEHREALLKHRRREAEKHKPKPRKQVKAVYDDMDRGWAE